MKTINYFGDSRYEKIWEQMQLLGIQDVSTDRQAKNGTIVWRLPILSDRKGKYLEYASFSTGYVRNQGVDCHSNWQINKRVDAEPRYFKLPNGDYRKYVGKVHKMIPIEIDRLEYMMKYVIKNEFIKRANYAHNSITKSQHIDSMQATESYYKDKLNLAKQNVEFHEQRANEYRNTINDVTVIIDGHKYKLQ